VIGRKLDALLGLIGLGTLVYVFFMVPIGARTGYEHVRRIAATEPARELGRDVERTSHEVTDHVVEKARSLAAEHLDGGLGGVDGVPFPR
jgi:hypothetical protein